MKKRIAQILAVMLALCTLAGVSAAQGEEAPAALNWRSIRRSYAYGQFDENGNPNGFAVMESTDGTTFGEMNDHIINRNCWTGTCVYLSRDKSGQIAYISVMECADGIIQRAHQFYPNGDLCFLDQKTTGGLRYDRKNGRYTRAEWGSTMWLSEKEVARKNIPEWADIFYTDVAVQIDESTDTFSSGTVLTGDVKKKVTTQSTEIYYVDIAAAKDDEHTRHYGVYSVDGVTQDGRPTRLLTLTVEKNGSVEIQWKNKTCSYDAEKNAYRPFAEQTISLKTQEDARLCRQAADAGDAQAQYALGAAYLTGEIVEQSYDEALKYFTLASEQGSGEAYLAMAKMYEYGEGVPKSAELARKNYFAAVDRKNAEALYVVGNAFSRMTDNEKNVNYGLYCLREAARQMQPDALYRMAQLYESGGILQKSSELAFLYYVAAADSGSDDAQFIVGEKYFLGSGVEQSYRKALPYLTRAADNGNADAQYWVGFTYYFGDGEYPSMSKATYEKAAHYFRLSADQGNASAQNWLGEMYADGKGVEQSYAQAAAWYALAAEQGDPTAQYRLGMLYKEGALGAPDDAKAEEYLKKAAGQKNRDACEALGDWFSDEASGRADREQALRYYQMAADLGSKKAKTRIEELTGTD